MSQVLILDPHHLNDRATTMNPNDIIVGDRLRPLNTERVAELERSIGAIGLQTPITIRYVDGKPMLIAGVHRLQAVKNLGLNEIPIREFEGDERTARMWEIAENLHRAELTPLERAEQIAEWIRLAGDEVSVQVDPKPQGGRPESGVNKAARELGIEPTAAKRAVKIDSLSPEAKVVAVELGLDDNQSALLQAAKAEAAEEQVEALKQRQERKRQPKNPPAAVVEPQEQPIAPAQQFSLGDLPFDAASAMVQAWFGTLTDELKVEHATKIVAALTINQQSLVSHGLDTEAEPVAAKSVQLEDEPAQTTPRIDKVGDRVSRLVARFNALSGDRQKWCRAQLDNPEAAISQIKDNTAWSDVNDCLTAYMASSEADRDTFRAQIGVAVAVEPEQLAKAA